jgi:hypothetical protein
MKVILRPLNRNGWAGVIKYKDCFEKIGPYLTRSGNLYTGLEDIVVNGKVTINPDRERLEKSTGLDLSPNSEYWITFRVRTAGKDIFLDTSDAFDEIRYLFLKNHKNVMSSIMDRKPTANFVLINQEDEAKEANNFNRLKRRAIKEFDKLTSEEIGQALRILGHNADNISKEIAEQKLYDLVEADPEKFLDKWVNNNTKDTEYLIKTAVSKNILRKSKNIYKYGTDIIGHTLEDTINYLDDTANQDLRVAIMKEVEVK